MTYNLHNSRGFTLIELVIVIVILGILAAYAAPKLGDFIENSKINATRQELSVLKQAFVGDPSTRVGGVVIDKGYIGDLGYPPAQLQDLVTKPSGDPAYDRFLRMGWNGPYINDDGSESYLDDAWDNAYTITDTSIVSNGPDGDFGTSDDIIIRY